eukprot:802265-Prorocentrum_minimum.AAC.3
MLASSTATHSASAALCNREAKPRAAPLHSLSLSLSVSQSVSVSLSLSPPKKDPTSSTSVSNAFVNGANIEGASPLRSTGRSAGVSE